MIKDLLWSIVIDPELTGRADKALLQALHSKKGTFTSVTSPEVPIHFQSSALLQSFSFSRSQLQKIFNDGNVTLQGIPIKSSAQLKEGAHVKVLLSAPIKMDVTPENKPINVLYEDSDLLVIHKPAGLSVHPSETEKENTLVHRLLFHVKDLSGIGGVTRPGIVHRIDKNTTGSLVIAKNDFTHQALSRQFSEHSIERKYLALVIGKPDFLSKKVETWIGRHPVNRKKMAVLQTGGKKAISHFRLVKVFRITKNFYLSLVEAELFTGRTHQVRVHLAHLKTPLLADPLYNALSHQSPRMQNLPPALLDLIKVFPGQALHAAHLSFQHPTLLSKISVQAPLPEYFKMLLEALESYEIKK